MKEGRRVGERENKYCKDPAFLHQWEQNMFKMEDMGTESSADPRYNVLVNKNTS